MKKLTLFLASLFIFAFSASSSAEYIDNGDGTIADTSTNLMWQQTYGEGDWDTAYSYCSQASTGGYTDWRLPTLTELQLLVDPSYQYPCIDPIFACDSHSNNYFWTSVLVDDSAWMVEFSTGGAFLKKTSNTFYSCVRCVRGATTTSNCISVGSDLSINIPCVQYNGVQMGVVLKYYYDPSLPEGLYWKLD